MTDFTFTGCKKIYDSDKEKVELISKLCSRQEKGKLMKRNKAYKFIYRCLLLFFVVYVGYFI